jgi:hypothetical protein
MVCRTAKTNSPDGQLRSAGEGCREAVDLGRSVLAYCGGRQIDGDDIKADGNLLASLLREALAKDAGERSEHTLLMLVDGELGGNDVAAGACLHLDEAEGRAIPGYEVDIAGEAGRLPTAGDDNEASLTKVKESFFFAANAGKKMRRTLADAAKLCGESIDTVEQALLDSGASMQVRLRGLCCNRHGSPPVLVLHSGAIQHNPKLESLAKILLSTLLITLISQ